MEMNQKEKPEEIPRCNSLKNPEKEKEEDLGSNSSENPQEVLRSNSLKNPVFPATGKPRNDECPNDVYSAAADENHESQSESSGLVDERLDKAEKLILKWDTGSSDSSKQTMIFEGQQKEDAEEYLRTVDDVQKLVDSGSVHPQSVINKAQNALQIAMVRLEEEFRHLLAIHSEPLESENLLNSASMSMSMSMSLSMSMASSFRTNSGAFSDRPSVVSDDEDETEEEEVAVSHPLVDTVNEMHLIPQDVILDLQKLAQRMVAAGYARECMQVYGSIRKPVIDESIARLGVEKLSIGDVQRLDWEALESKIKKWIRAAKVCVRMLFPSEKNLCDQIFAGLETVADNCFSDLAKGSTMQLFNFSEAIAISRRSPEKLFKILDLYETLSELLPDIETVFCSEMCANVKTQASEILTRLGEAARGIFTEFENAIQRETSKTAIPGGTIHPLTRYVMNYINFISDYQETLMKLIVNKPCQTSKSLPEGLIDMLSEYDKGNDSQSAVLSLHLVWVTLILQNNLEDKSKLYRDISLSHLFMMNNLHYIVQKVKSSDLRSLIGDDWLRKHSGKVRLYATNYQRATWVKVLSCLRDEGIHVSGGFSSGVSRTALKERFKSFNAAFEEVHRSQSAWIIPDPQLREELRISIAEKLLPAYRSFLGRFRNHLEGGRHFDMYIKYSPEDLENALLDLFEGSQVSMQMRKRSH